MKYPRIIFSVAKSIVFPRRASRFWKIHRINVFIRRMHAPMIFFSEFHAAAGKSFWTFSSTRNTGNVRPLPGDCPYHRFFLIRRVFSLLPLPILCSPYEQAVAVGVVSPLVVSVHILRQREKERTTTGPGQEESVSTCGEIIITHVTPYCNT